MENRHRRNTVEDALRSHDMRRLADNEIARVLSVSGWLVGQCRKHLEAGGEIPVVDFRLSHLGSLIDVRKIGKGGRGSKIWARGKYPEQTGADRAIYQVGQENET